MRQFFLTASSSDAPASYLAGSKPMMAAVGYNQQRGDVVTMENVPFYTENKPEEKPPAAPWYVRFHSQPYVMPAMKYGSFILLFFLAYLFLFRPMHKRVFEAMSVAALRAGESAEARLAVDGVKALHGGKQTDELPAAASGGPASLPAAESQHMEEIASLESATDEQIERELIREANAVEMGGRKYAAMKKKLIDKAKKDPEMVSQLIRTLLREKA